MNTRTAVIQTAKTLDFNGAEELLNRVRAYLPHNYEASLSTFNNLSFKVRITGTDDHGWTMDGYVIPRLASGNMVATETT